MSINLTVDAPFLRRNLVGLLEIPSPTGYTDAAIAYLEGALTELGLLPQRLVKGALIAEWAGEAAEIPRALTAHVDTLGAMVKEIKPNGRLKLTNLGSYIWNTVEGEGCWVLTMDGQRRRGSILLDKASVHVHGPSTGETQRSADVMEVRLDERTTSVEETKALGIGVGDFVALDPRLELGEAGFIRSRHLDDKAGVACVLAAIKTLQDAGLRPTQRLTVHFSNYEEVGHGAATGFPPDLAELIAVDMAAVGEGQSSDEFHTTICIKDSGGPYHHGLTSRLRHLAEDHDIPYVTDVYPYYASDGEAYWRAGGDVQVALVGPGVDASHNYERTHMESLLATTQLLAAYLIS